MKKPLLIICIAVVLLLLVGGISARKISHSTAFDYGQSIQGAVAMVGASGFAETAKLRQFLASPDMAAKENRLKALSFVGGNYANLAGELQQGLIYLSEQMTLPEEQRFASPPTFEHLTLPIGGRTDDAILTTTVALLENYMAQL